MISVPDATSLPIVRRPMRRSNSRDQVVGEYRAGNVGNARSRTMPAISQCPVTESLPRRLLAIRPNAAPCAGAGVWSFRVTTRVRPSAASVRMCRWTCRGDVAERVAALVTVGGGIGQFADADAVDNDQDDPIQRRGRGHAGLCQLAPRISGNRASRSSVADAARGTDGGDRVLENHAIGALVIDDHGEAVEVLDARFDILAIHQPDDDL